MPGSPDDSPPPYPEPSARPASEDGFPSPGSAGHSEPPTYPAQAPGTFLPPPYLQRVNIPPPVPAFPTAPPRNESTGTHPHHIPIGQRRTYLRAQQRGTDLTAWGSLILYLPHALCSFLVMLLITTALGTVGPVLLIAWLLSGLLVFHRPTEGAIARHLLGLRHPTYQEGRALADVWREVCARAGVRAENYTLWVEDSEDLNAVAAAGHIVGVTTYALHRVPNGQLGAVLAHELGHHVGGHAWASLLGYWYALPARLAGLLLRGTARLALQVSAAFSGCALFIVGFFLLMAALTTLGSLYGLPLLLLGAPYLLAAVSRRSELRADQHAAALGFAPMLAAVLHQRHLVEDQRRRNPLPGGQQRKAGTGHAKLLSSHPDHHTRLHALQPWLASGEWPD